MRILHVVHQYPPDHTGGTELFVSWFTHTLAQQGHEVAVFHRQSAAGSGMAQRDESGITIYSAWNGRFQPTSRFLTTFRSPPLQQAFNQVLATFKPELVHVHHLMGLPTQILTSLTQKGIPYIVTLNDFWWVCANAQLITNYSQEICTGPKAYLNCAKCVLARANQPQFPPAFPALAIPLAWRNAHLRRALKQASQIITPAKFVRQWYVEHGLPPEKITLLPPGLNYPRRPLTSPHTSFRVGYLGGLSWQKGVHVLVEAFNQLPPTAELWLAGDPDFDPTYVRRLKSSGRAQFLGKINRQAVWEMLAQLDVVVVPSLWYEAFCLVISEAFAMGVPVIAANLGVLSERIRPEVDGLLVPPGDVDQLAKALLRLHDEPDLLAKLRQNILPVPTVADHVAALTQLYHEMLKQNSKMRK